MTDYGQFYKDRDEPKKTRAQVEKERREAERKKIDEAFEEVVLKPRKTCSANSDLIKYTKHLKAMKKAMKDAEADGFCLDEIMDGLKVLCDE